MTKFNEAKNKYIPHMNTKANNKAKKHNYIPLDAKTRNMPKQEIKLKAQSEKQKLIWRKKLHKMLRAIPRFFGNMLTPKEKLTLVYQS